MAILALVLAFAASVIGGICGIGGGVIMKPVLDMVGFASVSTISFLSSCTVISMAFYNVMKGLSQHSHALEKGKSDVLAVCAALGGVLGNTMFKLIRSAASNDAVIGAIQSVILLLLVFGTMLYTIFKGRITPHATNRKSVCGLIGLLLGIVSSFLGIGGGPFNLAVLHYFLGYKTKRAVENSLYIILLSQAANILMSIVTASVPPFQVSSLLLMITGGITGGIAGKAIRQRLDGKAIDKLFIILMMVIILICVTNTRKYLVLAGS